MRGGGENSHKHQHGALFAAGIANPSISKHVKSGKVTMGVIEMRIEVNIAQD